MPRRLGQHFLARQSVLERIASAAISDNGGTIIEIGPGKGALTAHLLARAERVIAIEIDPVLVQYLRAKFREEPRIEIVESDILKTDLSRWAPAAIAGNLPYYITSPIIGRIVNANLKWSRAVFLVQKEVAERLTAAPGSRDYGFLSVQTQFFASAEMLFTVPASAFRPPPKVDSAVVRLTPKAAPAGFDSKAFLRFAGRCFHQKRKTIRNNLLGTHEKTLLDSLPETAKRAEQMPIPALIELFQKLNASATPSRD